MDRDAERTENSKRTAGYLSGKQEDLFVQSTQARYDVIAKHAPQHERRRDPISGILGRKVCRGSCYEK